MDPGDRGQEACERHALDHAHEFTWQPMSAPGEPHYAVPPETVESAPCCADRHLSIPCRTCECDAVFQMRTQHCEARHRLGSPRVRRALGRETSVCLPMSGHLRACC